MPQKSRLFFFILLNILVSALTVLTILWLWEKMHPLPSLEASRATMPSNSVKQEVEVGAFSTKTGPAPGVTKMVVAGVYAMGIYESENVQLCNHSTESTNLSGWQLTNNREEPFTFPALTLNADGCVKIFSCQGTNSVIQLYWNLPQAAWHSGDTVFVKDSSGIVQATYLIP